MATDQPNLPGVTPQTAPVPGAPSDMPPSSPPVGGPMPTPQPPDGEMAAADVQVQMAMEALLQTLNVFGATSPKGKAILEAVTKLSKDFGEGRGKAKAAVPAEIASLLASNPQPTPPQMPAFPR